MTALKNNVPRNAAFRLFGPGVGPGLVRGAKVLKRPNYKGWSGWSGWSALFIKYFKIHFSYFSYRNQKYPDTRTTRTGQLPKTDHFLTLGVKEK